MNSLISKLQISPALLVNVSVLDVDVMLSIQTVYTHISELWQVLFKPVILRFKPTLPQTPIPRH